MRRIVKTQDDFEVLIAKIFRLGCWTLTAMSCLRLYTHLHYGSLNTFVSHPGESFLSYWIGFRFDLSTFAYISLIPVLGVILFSWLNRAAWTRRFLIFLRWYYLLFLSFLVLCLAGDFGYYSYFQDHINILVFGLLDDFVALLKTFWGNYPVIPLVLGFTGLVFMLHGWLKAIFEVPRNENAVRHQGDGLQKTVKSTLVVVVLFVFARGSLGLFPLGLQDSVVSSQSFLNHLAYNGFHALARAFELRSREYVKWNSNMSYFEYPNATMAFADYFGLKPEAVPKDPLQLLERRTPKNTWAERTKPHVLVIMMESFGSAYLKYDSPEFQVLGSLKPHLTEDYLTLHFLPGNSSTIGSLSSFMIAAPQRPHSGFLSESTFLQVPFRTAEAQIFKSAGYQTHFVYGGNPGWRDINKFAKFQGYDSVEGDVDVEKALGPLGAKHSWGIFDEDLFKYLKKSLRDAKTPQLYLAMTTTNHPPYELPADYKVGPLQAPQELNSRLLADKDLVWSRFRAYQYANQKLGEFLSWLKSSELKDKIIVVVTGDHSFWMVNFEDAELFQKWGVPFYLYVPPAGRAGLISKEEFGKVFGSHFDILASLYPLALSEAPYQALGTNLLDPTSHKNSSALFSNALAFNFQGGVMALKGHDDYAAYNWESGFGKIRPGQKTEELEKLSVKYKSLMSLLDYYFNEEKKRASNAEPN